MAYYLWTGNYTREALQALVKSPQNREEAARKAIEKLGGRLHHSLVSLGERDLVVLMEFPDELGPVAISALAAATGAVSNGATTRLLTHAEFAEACKRAGTVAGDYKPPQG